MAAPKRTREERERDLERIAQLRLQGYTQTQIAEQLSLSRQQIGYDIKTLEKRWQETANEAVEVHKAREVAKMDNLERTYWDAWWQSLGETIVTTTTDESGGLNKKGEPADPKQKKTVRVEDLNGDPRYLQGALDCSKARREILGLNAPTEVTHGGTVTFADLVKEAAERREREAGTNGTPVLSPAGIDGKSNP